MYFTFEFFARRQTLLSIAVQCGAPVHLPRRQLCRSSAELLPWTITCTKCLQEKNHGRVVRVSLRARNVLCHLRTRLNMSKVAALCIGLFLIEEYDAVS